MKKIKHIFTLALAALASLGSATAQCDFACGDSLTISHVAGTIAPATVSITYGTVSFDSKCWFTRNLGASTNPASATDATDAAAGWYWQFNRKQGYSITGAFPGDGIGTRAPLTTWITAIDETADWQAENDPCTLLLGASWRIPTRVEYESALALGNGTAETPAPWANYTDTYASPLKLHAAGCLFNTTGALNYRGSNGYYWSSTQSSTTNGFRLGFNSSDAVVNDNNKAYGFSLRCCRNL